MNIEDLKGCFANITDDEMLRENGLLYAENKELQARIDKAIEYIENYLPYLQEIDKEYEDIDGHIYFTYKEWEGKELLDILKGSDTNE